MKNTNVSAAVELIGITKRFPGLTANDRIDLRLNRGEIHALLGENGAGKSTLMNILFGLYQPDEGEIRINGRTMNIDGPSRAIALGIGMVHQHFKLVQTFTVADNIILGSEPAVAGGLRLKKRAAEKRVRELSNKYGLEVDPRLRVEQISVGMQQRVEILKALYRGADILILDEPTAVLTTSEIEELMAILKGLAAEGKAIILITHKLKEIMQAADRVTVIRRGKVVGTVETRQTNENELAAMMVGRPVTLHTRARRQPLGKVVLQVDGLHRQGGRGRSGLRGVSFKVREGEIIGIAGVDGNGQHELVEVITGLAPAAAGSVRISGRDLTNRTPGELRDAGVAHIPEDRHKHGLVLEFSLGENMVLGSQSSPAYVRRGFLRRQSIERKAQALAERFDVRTPGIGHKVRALSGGNQQKAIIARELSRDPRLIVAVQPTRGLDIGAIAFVHERLLAAKEEGRAIVLVSYELDELFSLSDRVLVMCGGAIMGEMDAEQRDDEVLGLMMGGRMAESGGRHKP
ncbi:ABC transporter ATP-binding protein [Paenibacillus xylaniclasticus]|uniref:ABC transporter ATP-binding protein n=1 Tax=Paenibacillus xylaniclasticus TaxID=588083 RepID=UPI000FDAA556|nr:MULTISPECIES: ABC transporter ATP-binding protein [Paenibacillus]GFN33801.1 putative ABC transporter ATP-binding protein YufO [Paenibacillus curdlanolyticus]